MREPIWVEYEFQFRPTLNAHYPEMMWVMFTVAQMQAVHLDEKVYRRYFTRTWRDAGVVPRYPHWRKHACIRGVPDWINIPLGRDLPVSGVQRWSFDLDAG